MSAPPRRVQVLERDQVPAEPDNHATTRRHVSTDMRERTQTAYEESTEALQEYYTGIQLALSNRANARLAAAAIAAARSSTVR